MRLRAAFVLLSFVLAVPAGWAANATYPREAQVSLPAPPVKVHLIAAGSEAVRERFATACRNGTWASHQASPFTFAAGLASLVFVPHVAAALAAIALMGSSGSP